jgi:hypothetical protein
VYVVPSEELVIIRVGKPSMDWDDSALVNLVLGAGAGAAQGATAQ